MEDGGRLAALSEIIHATPTNRDKALYSAAVSHRDAETVVAHDLPAFWRTINRREEEAHQ
jgi:hypothetical protein